MSVTVVPLKRIAGINERALPDNTDPDRPLRYIDISSIGHGELITDPQPMRFEDAPSRARRLVRPGDTIVSTVRTYLRAVWPVSGPTDGLVVSTGFAALTPRSVDPRYFSWWVRSDVFIEEVVARSVGVSYPAINALELGEFPIRLPVMTQQRSIADFLDTEIARIDALIAKKRRMIELTEERFETAIVGAVRGLGHAASRRESSVEWISDIPAHWGTPWLGANYETQLGKMLNAEATAGPEQRQYLRNTDVQWDAVRLDDLPTMHFGAEERVHYALRSGDLLVCEGGEVGRSAVWFRELPDVYFQKAIHRVRPRGGGNTRFLMYCLRAAAYLDVFAVEGNQSTIVHLTREQLRAHRFPFPPMDEQEQIVRSLDTLRDQFRALTERLDRQIDLLQEHRQALITAAVTGQLEVSGVAA